MMLKMKGIVTQPDPVPHPTTDMLAATHNKEGIVYLLKETTAFASETSDIAK